MFETGINVEDYLKRINHFIKSGVNIKEINHNAKVIKNFAKYIKSEHGIYITPKLDDLKSIIKGLEIIEKGKNIRIIEKEFETVSLLFNNFFNESVVYLARHPDKVKENGRSLSHHGVRQTKKFAKFISEIILFCPKKVNLKINYSDIKRTYLVARAIEMKIKQVTVHQNKKVEIIENMKHPALYIRFTKKAIEDMERGLKLGKADFEIFSDWLHDKCASFPDHKKISNEIFSWSKQNLSAVNKKTWKITIGISHSFIIDCFLWYSTGGNISCIMETLEFIKMYPNNFYYRKKWYKF